MMYINFFIHIVVFHAFSTAVYGIGFYFGDGSTCFFLFRFFKELQKQSKQFPPGISKVN